MVSSYGAQLAADDNGVTAGVAVKARSAAESDLLITRHEL
jgi:hypothetical protein